MGIEATAALHAGCHAAAAAALTSYPRGHGLAVSTWPWIRCNPRGRGLASRLQVLKKDDAQAMGTMLRKTPRLLTATSEHGRGPLWVASFYRATGCVARLLQHPGIEVDSADEQGTTPLHVPPLRGSSRGMDVT